MKYYGSTCFAIGGVVVQLRIVLLRQSMRGLQGQLRIIELPDSLIALPLLLIRM